MISGCEAGADLPPLAPPARNAAYRLASGDEIRITTFDETNLSGLFGVDDGGNVAVPLLGPIHADGLTPRDLSDTIATELETRKLLAKPSVVVEIVKYRPIFVLGEVQRPGPYPFQPHMTMLGAVASAGGFTPRAVKNRASAVRSDNDGTREGILQRGDLIAPGDVITVLERNF